MVPDLYLVHHVHTLNHAAKDRVLTIQPGLRRQTDIELAAAALTLRIHVVAGARRRYGTAQMFFVRVDLGDDFISGTAATVAVGVAALDHEAVDHAMEGQPVVETF